jgi:pyroglutamyl-peptidase
MHALLTGFEPFRDWSVNSSGEAVKALADLPGVATRVLPVDHHAAPEALAAAVAEVRPAVILCTGLSPRPVPRLERHARRPETVAVGAPVLCGVWPWATALDAMARTGAPVGLSTDAGAYVCETVYWHALALRRQMEPAPQVAFLHVPPLGENWPLARVASLITACLSAAS